MKKLIILSLLLISIGVKAQTNPDSVWAHSNLNSVPLGYYPALKIDTVECWLKEAVYVKWFYTNYIECDKKDAQTVLEVWVKGYVISNNRSAFVEYLNTDRKTRITNKVLYSLE